MTNLNQIKKFLSKMVEAAKNSDVKHRLSACLMMQGGIFSNPISNSQTDSKGTHKCSSLHAEYLAMKAMYHDLTYTGAKGWARKSELKGIDFSKEN